MADDPIAGLASDPEFGQAPVNVQRLALSAHDPDFARAPDAVISQFVAAHQTANQQATQKIKSVGEQVMTGLGGGPNEREQTPQMKAQRAAGAKSQAISSSNYLPDVGMMAGATLASPTDTVFGPYGTVVGAGAGRAAGGYAKTGIQSMLGVNAPSQGQQAIQAGKNVMTGAEQEMGGRSIAAGVGLASDAVAGAIKRMAGVPARTAEEVKAYKAAQLAEKTAIGQRESAFRQSDKDIAEANAAQQQKYQQAQTDVTTANQAEQQRYKADLAQTKAVQAPPIPGQGAIYADLNQAIQVPTKDALKIKLGSSDYADAAALPGRGLAAIGEKAADLAPLSPFEQTARIAPAWHAAGQQIDAFAAQATAAGKIVDVRSIDDAVNSFVDENARKGMNRILTNIGKGMGLRAGGWTNITPTQALAMKRELYPLGEYGERVSQAISSALRKQVPELALADQKYADLTGAMEATRAGEDRLLAGKYKPTQFWTKLPAPPNYKPLPEAPTPVTPQVTYGQTSPVSPAGEPRNLKTLQDQLVKDYLMKQGKRAVVYGGPIAGAALGGYEAIDKLKSGGKKP